MDRREQLQEQYEDALFALLLDDIMEEEGRLLLEECKRLNADPKAAIPEDLDRKCRKLIRNLFRKERTQAARCLTLKVLKQIAVAAVIASLLFSVAYATVPEFRVGVKNLILTLTETEMATQMGFGTSEKNTFGASYNPYSDVTPYTLPDMPNGFELIRADELSYSRYYYYKNDDKSIAISIMGASEGDLINIDTEDADSVTNIAVNGYEGLCILKNGYVHIAWGDTDHVTFISVFSKGLDADTLLALAEQIKYFS